MSVRICTVAIFADELRIGLGNPNMLVIGDEVYIHDVTPELARQWIGVLQTIAEEQA